MNFNLFLLFANVFSICVRLIECQESDAIEIKAHKHYPEVKCYSPRISSMTKMRDNMYFISTNGQKYWFLPQSESANTKNSRNLQTITSDWHKIDSSIYYSYNAECSPQLRDKLVLVNYNHKTQSNEVMVGSLSDWKWESMVWNQLEVFNITAKDLDWSRSIDAMAIFEEILFIFQDTKQIQIGCEYEGKEWKHKIISKDNKITVTAPFDATYFDDMVGDTLPLYVITGPKLSICYIKIFSNAKVMCDESNLEDNSLTPFPECFVDNDPNKVLFLSMFAQILILLLLVLFMSVFAFTHLLNMWFDLSQTSGETNQTKRIEKISKSPVSPTTSKSTKPPVSPTTSKSTKPPVSPTTNKSTKPPVSPTTN